MKEEAMWVRVTNNNLETINVVDANEVTFRIQPGESVQVLVKATREGGVKLPMPKPLKASNPCSQ